MWGIKSIEEKEDSEKKKSSCWGSSESAGGAGIGAELDSCEVRGVTSLGHFAFEVLEHSFHVTGGGNNHSRA